jgi:hypothetical protein
MRLENRSGGKNQISFHPPTLPPLSLSLKFLWNAPLSLSLSLSRPRSACPFKKKNKNKFIYLFFNNFFLLIWTRVAILLATRGADV